MLRNASPDGLLKFALPQIELLAKVYGRRGIEQQGLHLEVVLLAPDENRLELTYRAAVPCDKRVLRVEQVEIGLQVFALDCSQRTHGAAAPPAETN
jgi:hypothetical protein